MDSVSKGRRILAGDDGGVDVVALFGVLWEKKLLISGVALVFALIAVCLALRATPMYRAEVVVTDVTDAGMAGTASSIAGQLGGLASLAGVNLGAGDGSTQNAQAVLVSRHLAEEFVKRNDVAAVLYPNQRPPSLWHVVNSFRKDALSIQQDKRSGTTTIAIECADPPTAARWANNFVALANELLRTRARDESSRNIEFLNKQIAQTNVIELQRVMYSLVEQQTKTLMLANARAEYAFRVADPAVAPEVRVSPKRTLMVLTGAALGVIFGALIALLLNLRSRRRAGA